MPQGMEACVPQLLSPHSSRALEHGQRQDGVELAGMKLVLENCVVWDPASHSQHTHPTFGDRVQKCSEYCVCGWGCKGEQHCVFSL